jgi:hypothetical protein
MVCGRRPGGSLILGAMNAGGDGDHPLSGVTVVAIEQAIAAPFAMRQLADLRAAQGI